MDGYKMLSSSKETCCGHECTASLVSSGLWGITIQSASVFSPGAYIIFQDVQVESIRKPTALQIRLKASKKIPFRVGMDVDVGHTQDDLCPVAALLA